MEQLITLDANILQSFINCPESILNRDVALQIAIATYPNTPHNLLEILANSDRLQVAEAAQMHVNYTGELAENWQNVVKNKLKSRYLGQNDRLAVELLKIAPLPVYFLSEYVPPEYLIRGLNNPYLGKSDRQQLLARLARESSLEPRLQVAESTDTPIAILEQLVGDLELCVRIAVEYNPNCPPGLVELVRGQYEVASNWDTNSQQLDNLSNSNWDWIRLAVAQNPSASEKTLLKLAGDKLFKIQLAVGKNPVTSARVLSVLAEHSSREIQATVAKHPNATEEILHSLFDTHQEAIKSRENLPASILERIFKESSKNPQVPLFLSQSGANIYFFTRQPNTPARVLAKFADIDLEELRTYAKNKYRNSPIKNNIEGWIDDRCNGLIELAKHPQVSRKILEQLSKLPNQRVQLAVAQNPKISNQLQIELLEELILTTNEYIICQIASASNTPASIIEKIVEQQEYQNQFRIKLRRLLTREPNADNRESIADVLMDDNHKILASYSVTVDVEQWLDLIESYQWMTLLEDYSYVGRLKERFAKDKSFAEMVVKQWSDLLPTLLPEDRQQVIDNILDLSDALSRLIQKQYNIKVALLENPNTSGEIREQFKNQIIKKIYNGDRDVFMALAYNLQVSETDREEYLQRLIERGNCAAAIAQNPLTPVHILEQLFKLGCETGRGNKILAALAKNSAIPEHIFRKIADLRQQYLWQTLAENPHTPANLLIKFVTEEVKKTVHSNVTMLDLVLANPNLPILNRYQLLLEQEEEKEIEKSNQILARRIDSPYALTKVLETGDRNAKIFAAKNPKTPIQVLKQLAKDEDRTIRSVIAENSNLPLEILLQLAEDTDVNIRAGLARDRFRKPTPIPILEKLAGDDSERVRAEVANNRNTPVEILKKLAYDSSTEVGRRLTRNRNTPVEVLEFLGVEKGIVDVYNANTPGKALAAAVEQTFHGNFRSKDKALNKLLKSYTSNMPAYILEKLANYPTPWIRSSVAHHHNTPASALEKMIDDDYEVVLWGIARNPNTPPDLLERLVNKPELSESDRQQIYPSIANRKYIPKTIMEKLLKCNLYGVRESIVCQPNLPLEIAEKLIKEKSTESVLVSLARNPVLTTELLNEFVKQ